MSRELISVGGFSYTYPERSTPALKQIDVSISEGEFVLLVGPSGGGKSTLAGAIAGFVPQFYGGVVSGDVYYRGKSLISFAPQEIRREVGMVFQNPEQQLVMTEVERELAFGLENLGLDNSTMSRRVAEVVSFLGLRSLRSRKTTELSSGEKQKVVLGSVLAMMPKVLVLDEPTSQLSPTAAREILSLLERLNRDLGLTIVLIEHRLEECLPAVERVIYLDEGQIVIDDSPENYTESAGRSNPYFVPPVARLFVGRKEQPKDLSIKAGRQFVARTLLGQQAEDRPEYVQQRQERNEHRVKTNGELTSSLLALQKVSFRYRGAAYQDLVLRDVDIGISSGEFLSVVGDNGAGKSTLLKVLAGVCTPTAGTISLEGRNITRQSFKQRAGAISYLSQDPNSYLVHDTVEEELRYTLGNFAIEDDGRIDRTLSALDIEQYRNVHPRDLSTGERQRVALASLLVISPRLILLDEPTRGLDALKKERLGVLLRELSLQTSTTVLLVTQDVEFAAQFANRVILLSEGRVLDQGPPEEVFHGNLFYSTEINRLFRGICDSVVNLDQAKRVLKVVHDQ